jgi:hypothetical protein
MKNYFRRAFFHVSLMILIITIFVSIATAQNMFRKVSDFDGDGKTDFAVTRNENGLKFWYIWQSTAGFKAVQWGIDTDQIAAGDYDGDGKTDFGAYRVVSNPDNVRLYIWLSQTNSFFYENFFRHNFNVPMQQDYDGDGKTDPASWASDGSGGGVIVRLSATGSEGGFNIPFNDFPLRLGDMDGDGHADKESAQSGSPYKVTIINYVTQATRRVDFGLSSAGDQFVPADFDGDGIGDLAIFRPTDGTWWWIRSSDNVVNAANWGVGSQFPYLDVPAPGDYDGDGKTDLAVYRRATAQSPQGYYWVNGSQNGVQVFAWVILNDRIVTY